MSLIIWQEPMPLTSHIPKNPLLEMATDYTFTVDLQGPMFLNGPQKIDIFSVVMERRVNWLNKTRKDVSAMLPEDHFYL